MADFPALPLRPPVVRERATRQAPRPRLRGPGAGAQAGRLDPGFSRLTAAFDAQRVTVPGDAAAHEPELVLVLEIAGELNDFVNAMRRIPGLEFLAEQMEDEVEPDEFAAVDRDGREHRYARQVFLLASDAAAWQEMLSLWERFKRGDAFPRGYAQFRHLFERLRSLRRWEDRDRLHLAGAADVWQRELRDAGDQLVHFEAELWWRAAPNRRAENVAELTADVEAAGGQVVSTYELEEIGYHGVLATAPAPYLVDAARRDDVTWLRTEGVRLFHAAGQFAAPSPEEIVEGPPAERPAVAPGGANPRLALLDGLPVERHELLVDRLVIDDPDGGRVPSPSTVAATGQAWRHSSSTGTWGGPSRRSRSRSICGLSCGRTAPDWVARAPEELPREELPVDLVHRAVARLFEGERVAPGVRAIVLAVADASQPFNRFVSPLARLLDWLAFRYGIVFLLAGGNQLAGLSLPEGFDPNDEPDRVQHEFLVAMLRDAALRRPPRPPRPSTRSPLVQATATTRGRWLTSHGWSQWS